MNVVVRTASGIAGLAQARYEALRERLADSRGIDAPMVQTMLEDFARALVELEASTEELEAQYGALRLSEQRVVRERERYRELFEFGPDGFFVTDMLGIIRAANRPGTGMVGVSSQALTGKPMSGFIAPTHRRAFRQSLAMLEGNDIGVRTLETMMVPRGGEPFPVQLRVARAQITPEGAELRWHARDVSVERSNRDRLDEEMERRGQIEETLDRPQRRYRHLVEHATDLFYELDGKGRFTYCNAEASMRLLGYDSSELGKRRLVDLVPEPYRKEVRVFTRRQTERPGVDNYLEFPVVAKDGRIVWLGQHATAIELPRGGSGLQAVCRDITEQMRARAHAGEEMRDWSKHLQEQVELERARIARDIHDELGAVLTGLRMELAMSTRAGEVASPVEHREMLLKRVDAALEATRRICSDLRPSLLDNMGLCAAIEWLAQDVQHRSHIRCKLSLDGLPQEPESSRATALYRIVQEATTNAIRHSNATALTIVQRCDQESVRITVSDNGCGIKATERAGRKSFGLLGMHERARAFGGRVHIDGSRGGGTRVRIEMPLTNNDKAAQHECPAG